MAQRKRLGIRPRLAFLSHVLPFPGEAGQQHRVRYLLEALRRRFEVVFITADRIAGDRAALGEVRQFVDETAILPSPIRSRAARLRHGMVGAGYVATTALKRSNYVIGRVEFAPDRLRPVVGNAEFDLAMFEYWYATPSVAVFHERAVPVVLDMHDILWRVRDAQLSQRRLVPAWVRAALVARYRRCEEAAWRAYDGLIAINREEERYVRRCVGSDVPVFYGPMGVDLRRWPYRWSPPAAPNVAFYGGLGNARAERDVLRCYERILPAVWSAVPDTTFLIIGSNPGARLRALASDERVRVLGFVSDVGTVLARVSAVLCPFSGTYGFRSRIVEVMATGAPTVVSSDAVHGMELDDGAGILLRDDDDALARATVALLRDPSWATQISRKGREQVVKHFGFEDTYGRLTDELYELWAARPERRSG
jgi:glycosyltransferase involved in cell wall biosynthesis